MTRGLASLRSLRKLTHQFADRAKAIASDQRGVAAIEFAFFAVFLSLALANVADVSIYIYQRMQAENATQVAAQAAWKTCDLFHLPATTKCQGLSNAIQDAIQSTSLGARVSLVGSPTEGYYCVNSSNTLERVADITSQKPTDCSAAGMPSLKPSDYIEVQTTFPYAPIFPGISVTSTFPTPINRTAIMRLG